ncbi:MAG: GNAT family protein, partial [Mycobacterium sp.]
ALDADPDVYRVWATCHVDNARSARLLQRSGFALEGRLTRHAVYPTMGPEPHDSLLYAKTLR